MWLPAIILSAASASPAVAQAQIADEPAEGPVWSGSAMPERPPILTSGRVSLGVGGGDYGVGTRLGSGIDVWPLRQLGLGLQAGWINQEDQMFSRSPASASFALLTAGPAFRTGGDSFYLQLNVMGGFGFGEQVDASSGCSIGPCDPEPEPAHHKLRGAAFGVHFGAYWHPSVFELGPFLHYEVLDEVCMTTLGFAFGAVIR